MSASAARGGHTLVLAPERAAGCATPLAGAANAPLAFTLSQANNNVSLGLGSAASGATLTFGAPARVAHLEFRNFYSASVSAEALSPAGRWSVVLPRTALMADPHSEADAQRWHRLRLGHAPHVLALRLWSHQPSPLWAASRLDSISAFGSAAGEECEGEGEGEADDAEGVAALAAVSDDLPVPFASAEARAALAALSAELQAPA